MKCSVCGAELNENEKICSQCGSPAEAPRDAGEPAAVQGTETVPSFEKEYTEVLNNPAEHSMDTSVQTVVPPEPKKKKTGLIIGAAVAAVAVIGAAVFAMNREDPKEVVINAFETVYTEDQVKPMEELFGFSQFAEASRTKDVEGSVTIVMDNCSDPQINEFKGSGIRINGRDDKTNKKSFANIGVIYKDMDLVNMDAYYGDETLMVAIPELSTRVFTMDLSDGLMDRIQSSPLIGPALEMSGIDVQGFADYLEELSAQAESGELNTLDFDTLMTRYREGTQAQEKFKEALVVEKGEKGTFTVDGQEVSCKGYKVLVSKDSMMEFLRTSTDFFLNDQELKDQYLSQLERSVKLAEIMGGTSSGISAADLYLDSMEDVTEAVNEMIDFLDESLNDVDMNVYVTKNGRLAAVEGTTVLKVKDSGITSEVNIDFDVKIQGGSYPTENMLVNVELTEGSDRMAFDMTKQGSYDGKKVTSDVDLNLSMSGSDGFDMGGVWTGSYDSDSGDYHMGLSCTMDRSLLVDISMTGVVDQLEKGNSVHMSIDEFKVAMMDQAVGMTLSGEYSYKPLAEPVTPLEGEQFDVIAADESQWESVIMEFYMGIMQLAGQLSM